MYLLGMGVCLCLCLCVCVYHSLLRNKMVIFFRVFIISESLLRVLQIDSVSVYAGLVDEMRKDSDSHQK